MSRKSGVGHIYLIELSNSSERFYKIGITVHRYCRFYEIIKRGYQVRIVFMVMGMDYKVASELEIMLHNKYVSYEPMIRFGGHTECFDNINIDGFINDFPVVSHSEVVRNLDISWR